MPKGLGLLPREQNTPSGRDGGGGDCAFWIPNIQSTTPITLFASTPAGTTLGGAARLQQGGPIWVSLYAVQLGCECMLKTMAEGQAGFIVGEAPVDHVSVLQRL